MKYTGKDDISLYNGKHNIDEYLSNLEVFKEYNRKKIIYSISDVDDIIYDKFIHRVILVEGMIKLAREHPDNLIPFITEAFTSIRNLVNTSDESDTDAQMFRQIVRFFISFGMKERYCNH